MPLQFLAANRPEEIRAGSPNADIRHEADHRIANSLQLVAALLASEGRQVADPLARQTLDQSVQRITAIAAVHRQLYRAQPESGGVELGSYLLELTDGLRNSLCRDIAHRGLVLEAAPLAVPPAFATLLGIVITEQVINACKHAYAPEEAGDVTVQFAAGPHGAYALTISDTGRGGAAPADCGEESGAHFGSRLIAAITRQLECETFYRAQPRGTAFVMRGTVPGGH